MVAEAPGGTAMLVNAFLDEAGAGVPLATAATHERDDGDVAQPLAVAIPVARRAHGRGTPRRQPHGMERPLAGVGAERGGGDGHQVDRIGATHAVLARVLVVESRDGGPEPGQDVSRPAAA